MPIPSAKHTRNARIAGVSLLAAVCVLAGCATGPRLASPAEMGVAPSARVEGVPFHGQQDYQCGPASLAMALNASGVEVSVDTLIGQVFLPGRKGSVQAEMQAAVRRHDRIGFVLDGNFPGLLIELDAGHPVVVLQNLSLQAWPVWHYAVAIGYDLDRNLLELHSGDEAHRLESFRRFDATWARSERWAMVVLAPGELPAAIRPYRAMEAIAAFEQANSTRDALPAWRSVTERWPAFALGWFALGNAEHAAGNPGEAIAHFREATRHDPGMAAAWLNLGLALEALEKHGEAREALQRAASLPSQWQDTAAQALARLEE